MSKRDARGNTIGKEGRFFALQHHMLNSKAWRSLTPQEVAVYIRAAYRYNGANNGRIALSTRDAAAEAKVSKNTAAKALTALCEKGLLKVAVKSSFGTNGRHATQYALTCFPAEKGKPASREYQDWIEPKEEKSSYHMKDTSVPYRVQRPKLRVVS